MVCVNDGAVMEAWSRDQGVAESPTIRMLSDNHSHLTQALGIQMTGADNPFPFAKVPHPYDGPNKALGFHTKRCKRGAFFVDHGMIKVIEISEAPTDPAGDNFPESSCVENMLERIAQL